jgi:hypothetical protein
MHRNRIRAMVFALLLLTALERPGDAGMVSREGVNLVPTRTAIELQATFAGGAVGEGLDINASYLLTNVGIQARTWNAKSDDRSKSEFGVYGGVGVVDVVQVQVGYFPSGAFLLRLRSDVPLTLTRGAWEQFNKGRYWILTPLIEIPLSSHHAVALGIGVGRSF